ncbi:MAG: carboxyvinyl-carboxyphosphonate phosphorylmutase [Rhodobacteraceae bacterium]|jgi:2-methylisocitrate lyase-like PEP mutase family enzyme|nr:carboxyvinyl-carboxyphosphonate phosphorylmutase [Rhodobacterales bacterium]NCV68909.1 carboxyvinyl-carboxyphosphonate phosphorylmutase [Paracoccaceae bacterium]NCW08039.1 carboxyvinyl-carboxyphosphonate phosphorylmutase [Rhodobacterales bacterium]NCX21026.1 carboxyvinyl-carboxyphosphonate phosphorylmutase [Paracoccaceae bacterium]
MTKTLVEQLESGDFITAPGVFDMISTLIATRMNFPALYVTGYGISASYMGLPDAGLMTFTDMETQIRKIVAATDKPVIADADTGYGGLLNVRHTVKAYENLGVSAIQIEDQEYPKKCGHTPGRRVIPTSDMVTKIKVAVDTRTKDDFLIIARTDSRTGLGIEEAISRAVAFEEAGADIIFVEAPETESEMKMVNAAIKKPTLANMVSGGKTPIFSSSALQDMGYSVAIHPALGFLAMGEALKTAYTKLDTTGNVTGVALEDFGEFSRIMGFEDVWDFEKKWADG